MTSDKLAAVMANIYSLVEKLAPPDKVGLMKDQILTEAFKQPKPEDMISFALRCLQDGLLFGRWDRSRGVT